MHRLLHDESILFADNDREIFDKRRTFYESIPNSAEWLHTGNLFLLQLVDETIEVHQETSNRLPNVRHPGNFSLKRKLLYFKKFSEQAEILVTILFSKIVIHHWISRTGKNSRLILMMKWKGR